MYWEDRQPLFPKRHKTGFGEAGQLSSDLCPLSFNRLRSETQQSRLLMKLRPPGAAACPGEGKSTAGCSPRTPGRGLVSVPPAPGRICAGQPVPAACRGVTLRTALLPSVMWGEGLSLQEA